MPATPTTEASSTEPQATPAARSPELGEIVGALTQGWRCPSCQYDLHHQAVHIEPKYQFLVSRCPECGRVWPVQMQELKPKTHRMIGFASVIIWGAFVLAGVLGTAFFMFGISISAADVVRWDNDPVAWFMLVPFLTFPIVLIPVTVVAALGLPHLRTSRLVLLSLLPIGFATAFVSLFHLLREPDDIRLAEVGASALALFVGGLVYITGALIARRIARVISVLFMSTTLRNAVSGLWTADGREPPANKPLPNY